MAGERKRGTQSDLWELGASMIRDLVVVISSLLCLADDNIPRLYSIVLHVRRAHDMCESHMSCAPDRWCWKDL